MSQIDFTQASFFMPAQTFQLAPDVEQIKADALREHFEAEQKAKRDAAKMAAIQQANEEATRKLEAINNRATHDYSDRYCAHRDRGVLIALCKVCGLSEDHAARERCMPAGGVWRERFEHRVSESMAFRGLSFGAVLDPVYVRRPSLQSVTSSGASIGVWSLRDEG